MNTLKQYIRKEQEFQIYIYVGYQQWEAYDPARHGEAKNISFGYVVAYPNGEILENTVDSDIIPVGTYYPGETTPRSETMPECVASPSVEIKNIPSLYHNREERYCTRIRNTGAVPFKINRFAAFHMLDGRYVISTITGDWYTCEQFRNWFNQSQEWINPGEQVADQDNYGYGIGYWVFEISFQTGDSANIKVPLPRYQIFYGQPSLLEKLIYAGIAVIVVLLVLYQMRILV